MERDEALRLMESKIGNLNLRRHMLATEAVMRALARRLGEDEALWGLAGLLHDIDLEQGGQDPAQHARLAAAWLEGQLPPEALDAIRSHNGERLGIERATRFAHALAAAETVTGLVVAATLVLPGKKIAELKPQSVLKRMKEPRFAAGVNRDIVRECEHLPVPLADFVSLAVEAMRPLGPALGL
jgi:putative nucleotidyltransferase with HDIG domain